MSPNCEGGRKVIALLSIGPDVRTYTVAPAHLAIHERDDAISLALWCSEPNRILRVLKHWPSQVNLATPRRTASTVEKAAVTQVMLRRFDLTIGMSLEPSDILTLWRGLLVCRFAGFLRAIVFLWLGLRHLECLSLWLPSLTGLGARVSARLQMRPTQRLTAVASKLSTVRMIDKLSLQLSVFGPLQGASGTETAGSTHSTLPPS